MIVRLIDVARDAGVSTATVSRVLAGKPHVREETRERVLAAVKKLGYQPSRVARTLQGRRSRIIGVLIPDIQNPFFTQLVRAVEDVAYEHGYAVFLCNTDSDDGKEEMYTNVMLAEHVAGIVASPTTEKADNWQRLCQHKTPVVLVDRRVPDARVDTVVIDNINAAYRLVTHLIEQGHTRIGAVLAESIITTGRERYEGYVKALEGYRLPAVPELIKQGAPREADGYRLTSELLDLPVPPSALFTGNNLLTMGALRALQERGIGIPDEMALVAFDEPEWRTLIQPQLTVVVQPTYQLGKVATELLFQRLDGDKRPWQEVMLEARIVIRDSSADRQR